MSGLRSLAGFAAAHPLLILLGVAVLALLVVVALPQHRAPFDGDDDNPNGGNWP